MSLRNHKRLFIILTAVLMLSVFGGGIHAIFFPGPAHAATTPPAYTTSYYKTTLNSTTMQNEGCTAAHGNPGLVVLDYGEQYFSGGSYGALLISANTFASDSSIQSNVIDFLRGANSCSIQSTQLKVAVGTSNYNSQHLTTAQLSAAGKAWAGIVNATNDYIHLNQRIQVYGADDIELGYSTYQEAKSFVDGFTTSTSATLVDYGDDPAGASGDGSAGNWTPAQVWYVSSGAPHTAALPEIYYSGNTPEWQALSAWACTNKGSALNIIGTMAQNGYQSSYMPAESWQSLYTALSNSSNSCVRASASKLLYSTNIVS
ncbi:hypothetical protein KDA_64190 [Dictyobacter alpinus]|uniref:Uncharacterized protein n=1 Tax=Dictyobacter alpinus TaxID=2014873 RepID=A0A402BHU7_9CHLR|nr:hypothetical protein [Dictyobacter alpinus]GCE30935.1 hypothetical protein KDA_64190 [Dictyobacter alpinus]